MVLVTPWLVLINPWSIKSCCASSSIPYRSTNSFPNNISDFAFLFNSVELSASAASNSFNLSCNSARSTTRPLTAAKLVSPPSNVVLLISTLRSSIFCDKSFISSVLSFSSSFNLSFIFLEISWLLIFSSSTFSPEAQSTSYLEHFFFVSQS